MDVLEIDIHRTADHELIVMHDPTLERTTNGHGNIHEHLLQEIRQLDAGQGEKVPLLKEAIQLAREISGSIVRGGQRRNQPEERRSRKVLFKRWKPPSFLSQTIVTSFSAKALLRAKALNPEVSTMLDPFPQDGSLTARQICAQALADRCQLRFL